MVSAKSITLIILTLGLMMFSSDRISYAEQTSTPLSIESLKQDFFESIEFTSDSLIIKLKTQGRRYLISIDGKDAQKSQYGQIIVLPIGKSLVLKGKNESIHFSGISDAVKKGISKNGMIKGFSIEQKADHRSAGGSVQIKKALMYIEKSSGVVSGSADKTIHFISQ